jgi:hypothetical protein
MKDERSSGVCKETRICCPKPGAAGAFFLDLHAAEAGPARLSFRVDRVGVLAWIRQTR